MAFGKIRWQYLVLAVGSIFLLFFWPFEDRFYCNMKRLFLCPFHCLPDIIRVAIFNIDWLYWCLLFVPFYAFYICVGEKLFMLKGYVNMLQQDVSGKTKFIEWQNMALKQLDLRLMDLHKEVDTLRKSNENFKKGEEAWRKHKELMKKKIREQQRMISNDTPIVREKVFNTVRQEILTLVKKNNSEGDIKNKKLVERDPPAQQVKKHKSSNNKSLPSIVMDTKKCSSQEWERARLRLMERSKRILKKRGETEKPDDQYDKICDDPKTADEMAACLSTVHDSETDESSLSVISSQSSKSASNVQSEICADLQVHSSRSSEPLNKSFTTPGVPGYGIREFVEPKVKSYTEVFKRRVHVPTGGSGPRITIEGQRRWCF